jgi:hypothetical protein
MSKKRSCEARKDAKSFFSVDATWREEGAEVAV